MSSTLVTTDPRPAWPELDHRSLHGSHGWSLAVRLGWRDSGRHVSRTALAMLMIGLPVLLASAAATVVATNDLNPEEQAFASLGSADIGIYPSSGGDATVALATARRLLDDAPIVALTSGSVPVSGGGTATIGLLDVTDPGSPVTAGMFDVLDGRLPAVMGEVAVTPGLLDSLDGRIGDVISVSGEERTVTGTATRHLQSRVGHALVAYSGDESLLGSRATQQAQVLAITGGPPSDRLLGRLESADTYSFSRGNVGSVDSWGRLMPVIASRGGAGDLAIVAGSALTLVVIQLTLLAGPAFAVGVRQQRRTLAQLVASGADAAALRRVVTTQAAMVGASAALAGAALGVLLGLGFMTLARDRWPGSMGSLDVPWAVVATAAGIGFVSALLAALAPAVTAARQSVRGSLAMSRGQTGYPWRRAAAGVLVFAGSVVWLWDIADSDSRTTSTSAIAGVSAGLVTLTVGLLLVVPMAVALLLPLGRVLPPVWRLATRDAARASTRSVAAVAAVAAATGGLVALSTYYGSLAAFNSARYRPTYETGTALVTVSADQGVERVSEAVAAALPDAAVTAVPVATNQRGFFWSADPGCGNPTNCAEAIPSAQIAVTDEVSLVAGTSPAGVTPTSQEEVTRTLAAGGIVVSTFYTGRMPWGGGPAVLKSVTYDDNDQPTVRALGAVTALVVPERLSTGTEAALSPDAAVAARVGATPDRLIVGDGELTVTQLRLVTRSVSGLDGAYVDAEYGYRQSTSLFYTALVVAALLAVVGGTLAATALTLADARRERSVVAAVGAGPRTARLSAGATAVVIAALGGVTGTVLGLVPGILGARSQTDWYSAVVPPTVVIPWLAIGGVIVALPLLLGALVALAAPGPSAIEGARASAWRPQQVSPS